MGPPTLRLMPRLALALLLFHLLLLLGVPMLVVVAVVLPSLAPGPPVPTALWRLIPALIQDGRQFCVIPIHAFPRQHQRRGAHTAAAGGCVCAGHGRAADRSGARAGCEERGEVAVARIAFVAQGKECGADRDPCGFGRVLGFGCVRAQNQIQCRR